MKTWIGPFGVAAAFWTFGESLIVRCSADRRYTVYGVFWVAMLRSLQSLHCRCRRACASSLFALRQIIKTHNFMKVLERERE